MDRPARAFTRRRPLLHRLRILKHPVVLLALAILAVGGGAIALVYVLTEPGDAPVADGGPRAPPAAGEPPAAPPAYALPPLQPAQPQQVGAVEWKPPPGTFNPELPAPVVIQAAPSITVGAEVVTMPEDPADRAATVADVRQRRFQANMQQLNAQARRNSRGPLLPPDPSTPQRPPPGGRRPLPLAAPPDADGGPALASPPVGEPGDR